MKWNYDQWPSQSQEIKTFSNLYKKRKVIITFQFFLLECRNWLPYFLFKIWFPFSLLSCLGLARNVSWKTPEKDTNKNNNLAACYQNLSVHSHMHLTLCINTSVRVNMRIWWTLSMSVHLCWRVFKLSCECSPDGEESLSQWIIHHTYLVKEKKIKEGGNMAVWYFHEGISPHSTASVWM